MKALVHSIYLSALLSLGISSSYAFAVSDVIGTAGDFTRETGSRGAVANRQIADQLYKQSLADEKAAWSSFPPNVALLSKALAQSKDAKLADDQAKEFARAALHGIHTGGNSGEFKLKEYGVVSEKELNNLANSSSQYRGAVESKLGKYGMKLSDDQMSVKTPLGELPINMSISKLEGGLRKIAENLGYKADDVSKGLRAAEQTRDGIAAQVMAAVDKNLGSSGAASGTGDLDSPATTAAGGELPAEAKNGAGGAEANQDGTFVQDDSSRQAELLKNREMFLQKLGASTGENLGPMGSANDDLFRMVHVKYQSMRAEGVFIESEIIQLMASAEKPSLQLRSKQKVATRLPASNGPIRPMSQSGTP